jgi:ribosomal-protein-alanine N-acetyltransferase
LLHFYSDPQTMATLGGLRSPEQVSDWLQKQLDHWNEHAFGWWLIRDRQSGGFLGRGGLKRVHIADNDEVEIGYGLLPEYWGRGLAAEMSRECVRLAFEVLALESIVCFTMPTNTRSRRVMEKVGFVYERDTIWFDLPHVLYRLTAADHSSACGRETSR